MELLEHDRFLFGRPFKAGCYVVKEKRKHRFGCVAVMKSYEHLLAK